MSSETARNGKKRQEMARRFKERNGKKHRRVTVRMRRVVQPVSATAQRVVPTRMGGTMGGTGFECRAATVEGARTGSGFCAATLGRGLPWATTSTSGSRSTCESHVAAIM